MTPLAPGNLALLKFALPFLLFVHLAFVGVMAAGCALSLLFRIYAGERKKRLRRLSEELLARVTLGRSVPILVLGSLATCLAALRMSYPEATVAPFLWTSIFPLLVGLLFLRIFRLLILKRSDSPLLPAVALFGFLSVSSAYLLLALTTETLLRPEKWPLLAGRPTLILSWHGFAEFLQFFDLSFALTGAGMILFACRARARSGEEEEYLGLVRKAGAVVALVALLLWPPCLLLHLVNLPDIALSGELFALAAATIPLAAGIFLALPTHLKGEAASGGPLFAAFLTFFFLWVLLGHLGRERVFADQAALAGTERTAGAMEEAEPTAPPPAPGETPLPKTPEGAPAVDGKEIFERICTPCHHFDRRLVGPPLDSVLPKYAGAPDSLAAFIRDPAKVSPDYPPMPRLGLSEEEIEALAGYLLKRRGK